MTDSRASRLVAGFAAMVLALAAQDGRACVCETNPDFFTAAESAQLVVVGRVISHQDASPNSFALWMDVAPTHVLRGIEGRPVIRVWGFGENVCSGYIPNFPIGTLWAFALDPYGFDRATEFALDLCRRNWVRIKPRGDKRPGVLLDDLRNRLARQGHRDQ